jgi:Arm domain-containing DNA-binding protein
MKLTDSSLRALKPKSERYEVWENNGKGFGMRVSPAGRKTFIFMYRFDGVARRMTIGNYPALTLSEAHELHAKARQAYLRDGEAIYGDIIWWPKGSSWRNQSLTANTTARYLYAFLNTKESGPVVLDLPAA